MKVNYEILNQIEFDLKLKSKDFRLLMEAYRRKNVMPSSNNKDYNSWVGLGYPSQYKSIYFKSFDGIETPRINNWYVLTDKGIEVLKAIEKAIGKIPQNQKSNINDFLFTF